MEQPISKPGYSRYAPWGRWGHSYLLPTDEIPRIKTFTQACFFLAVISYLIAIYWTGWSSKNIVGFALIGLMFLHVITFWRFQWNMTVNEKLAFDPTLQREVERPTGSLIL